MLIAAILMSLSLGQVSAPPPADALAVPASTMSATVDARRAQLNQLIVNDSLRDWHMDLAKEPHVAGTEGGAKVIEKLRVGFERLGLTPEVWDFWPLLAEPVAASLEITAPETLKLDLAERPVRGDPDSGLHGFGWNAYSGSGEVEAGVVYANYGTKADFERLATLGVAVKGKIILARYGGNYRGYKAKFAQAAGAAGLIIYTDPADSGYMRGLVYPEGGYANDCCIQRGSIVTLPWQGDPLTPGIPATRDAERIDESEVALPRIPVQPAGYAAAKEIIARMTGAPVPEGWQGGLPHTYRLDGGPDLKLRLKVEQKRSIKQASNVLARIEGSTYPEQLVIVGCHHDAWNNGAADPLAGTIAIMECAKAFAALEKQGQRPLRTIVFGTWDAEEFGIIGSSEWVEAHRDPLTRNAVAYINLDMASMGLDFNSAASPSLRRVIMDAASTVPQPGQRGMTVLEAWTARAGSPDPTRLFGDLGGGSDHVGFLCHAGVPSCSLGGGGSKGTSYHSAYDTLPWYWKTVGTDYESAAMVARMTAQTLERLAFSEVIPLDPTAYATDLKVKLLAISKTAGDKGLAKRSEAGMAHDFDAMVEIASMLESEDLPAVRGEVAAATLNRMLIAADRVWLSDQGLPGRTWFRNQYAAPDEDSGYASWILPALRRAAERGDAAEFQQAIQDLESRLKALFTTVTTPPTQP